MLIIGIDGGGTKTEALLFHLEKGVIVRLTDGASNPHSTSFEKSTSLIVKLVNQLAEMTEITNEDVYLSVGISGLGRESDRVKWRQLFLEKINLPFGLKRIMIENDAKIALYSGTYGASGITTISGTGAITYGMNGDHIVRVGGWGHLVNADPGSGYFIGYEALKAVFNSYDESGPKTSITDLFLLELKLNNVPEIIRYLYQQEDQKTVIASFAKLVFVAADEDDPVANGILDNTVRYIVCNADIVYKRLYQEKRHTTKVPHVLVGGIYKNKRLREKLKKGMETNHHLYPVYPHLPPIYGAIVIALKEMGYQQEQIKQCLMMDFNNK